MTQATWWIGTKFVNELHDSASWMEALQQTGKVRFITGQREICPNTGNHHIQYVVQLARTQRLAWLKKNIDVESHFEPVKGTPKQAMEYCTKLDTRREGPWEFGQAGEVGKRKGYDDAVAEVCSGRCLAEIAAEYPTVWVKYGRGLVDLRKQLRLDSDRRVFDDNGPELWIFHGESGTGKSRRANEFWPDAYWKIPGEKWWDGYTNQETVILDDFKGSFMRLTDFQRLIDRYPLWVEVKGGSIPMLATRYVITSNEVPSQWYASADPHNTVIRRCLEYSNNGQRMIEITGDAESDDAKICEARAGCAGFAR